MRLIRNPAFGGDAVQQVAGIARSSGYFTAARDQIAREYRASQRSGDCSDHAAIHANGRAGGRRGLLAAEVYDHCRDFFTSGEALDEAAGTAVLEEVADDLFF